MISVDKVDIAIKSNRNVRIIFVRFVLYIANGRAKEPCVKMISPYVVTTPNKNEMNPIIMIAIIT